MSTKKFKCNKMTKYKINVTKEDIQKGIPDQSEHCPIALAMKRRFKTRVSVSAFHYHIYGTWCKFNRELPRIARQFIHEFDNKQRVKPFSFTIEFEAGETE